MHDKQQFTGDVVMGQHEFQNIIAASVKLHSADRINKISSSVGAITITLPAAAECPDLHLSLHMIDNGVGTPTVATITGKGLRTNLVIDADNEAVLLFSTGEIWFVVSTFIV